MREVIVRAMPELAALGIVTRDMGEAARFYRLLGVDDVHAAVGAAGFHSKAEPYDAFWVQRYATVLDPDDNAVDLFAPL